MTDSIHQAGALRGEPEAAGHERFEAAMKLFYRACGAWSDVRFDHQHAHAGEIDLDKVKQAGLAEAAARTAITELFNESARPPQAASGCSRTARSDDPITKFGIKPHSTLAQLKDDEDLRLYVQAHIEEARSAEQGATPPAPAALDLRAAKHCCAILGAACEHHTHREIREAWKALHAALAASPQPAAPEGWKLVPIEATPGMVQAYLRANDAYWHRTDALPNKLRAWWRGTQTKATAESYRAMLAAAPAAEGGAL